MQITQENQNNEQKVNAKPQTRIERRSASRNPYAFVLGHGGSKICTKCGSVISAIFGNCRNCKYK